MLKVVYGDACIGLGSDVLGAMGSEGRVVRSGSQLRRDTWGRVGSGQVGADWFLAGSRPSAVRAFSVGMSGGRLC